MGEQSGMMACGRQKTVSHLAYCLASLLLFFYILLDGIADILGGASPKLIDVLFEVWILYVAFSNACEHLKRAVKGVLAHMLMQFFG